MINIKKRKRKIFLSHYGDYDKNEVDQLLKDLKKERKKLIALVEHYEAVIMKTINDINKTL